MSPPPTNVRRLYYLTSAQHGISSISLRRIKVARLNEVNDPFELMALNCLKGGNRRALKEFKALKTGQIGMVCFSEVSKNSVMWSHYADRHRGMCLGFDVDETLGISGIRKVVYEAEKLKLDDDLGSTEALPPAIQERLLVIKFKDWAYEKEWRVFVELSKTHQEGGLYFLPFDDARLRLREVVLGPECPGALYKPTLKLVRATNPGAAVSRARLGFKFFEVKEDGNYKATR